MALQTGQARQKASQNRMRRSAPQQLRARAASARRACKLVWGCM